MSKKGHNQITEAVSPIQFSKYLNRKSELEESPKKPIEIEPLEYFSETPILKMSESRNERTMSFAPLPPEEEKDSFEVKANNAPIKMPVEKKKPNIWEKLFEKGDLLSYVLIVLGIILIFAQILK